MVRGMGSSNDAKDGGLALVYAPFLTMAAFLCSAPLLIAERRRYGSLSEGSSDMLVFGRLIRASIRIRRAMREEQCRAKHMLAKLRQVRSQKQINNFVLSPKATTILSPLEHKLVGGSYDIASTFVSILDHSLDDYIRLLSSTPKPTAKELQAGKKAVKKALNQLIQQYNIYDRFGK